jgi:hypothetical protein
LKKIKVIGGIFLVFCSVFIIPAFASETPSPGENPSGQNFRYNYDFISFVYNLINDALDLLPDDLEKIILKDQKVDVLLEGALAFDPQQSSLKHSLEPINFGAQASYIVLHIYGGIPVNAAIPQAIYYNGFDSSENFSGRIVEGKKDLARSSHLDRDKYNLALNLLTDIWLVNLKKSGQKITDLPKEGVYLRDANEELYLYEETQK